MALHWGIEKVADWQELANDERERVITEAVVFATLAVDMPRITESNWKEFARRLLCWRMATGDDMSRLPGPADVRRRIGLWTNVTERTKAAFQSKLGAVIADRAERNLSVALRELEAAEQAARDARYEADMVEDRKAARERLAALRGR